MPILTLYSVILCYLFQRPRVEVEIIFLSQRRTSDNNKTKMTSKKAVAFSDLRMTAFIQVCFRFLTLSEGNKSEKNFKLL